MGLGDLTLIFCTRNKLVLETHFLLLNSDLLRKQEQWKTSQNIYLLADFGCIEEAVILAQILN